MIWLWLAITIVGRKLGITKSRVHGDHWHLKEGNLDRKPTLPQSTKIRLKSNPNRLLNNLISET